MTVRFPCTASSPRTKTSGAAPGASINLTLEEARFLIAAGQVVAPTAAANTVAPAVTGTAQVGQTLSCTQGTWTGSNLVYSYEWRRVNGPEITHGNGASTYVCAADDVGYALRCVVRAVNGAGMVRRNCATDTATVIA